MRVVAGERPLSVTELEKLCTAFLKLSGIREQNSRELYIDALNGELTTPLFFARHPDPQHDVWSLLRACQEHSGGIRRLTAIVRAFHRDSRPMAELDELVECLFPDEFLLPDERVELLKLLGHIDPQWLPAALRYAGPPSLLTVALDWTDPVTVVRRLEACVVVAGRPPPLLVFVDFLAHQVDAVRSAEHHRWLDQVGDRVELATSGLRDLCVAATARLDQAQQHYFVVQLQPDGVDPTSYLLSVWLQHHRTIEEPLHRDDTPLTLAEIVERLPDLLSQAHSAAGVGGGELILEFILPRSLIGQPVDQWQVDRVFPHRIGTSHPVVVRSLDRLQKRELHNEWQRKWRWLTVHGHREDPDAIYWLHHQGVRPPALRAGLLRGVPPVALAMAFPPEDKHELIADELTAALYAGMPIVLWCRNALLRQRFEREIRETLTGRGLTELPSQVLRMRREADEVEESEPLGRHLTLLWDDADRIPESFTHARLKAPQPHRHRQA
ncbi:hypothetical protein F0L68_15200 [Solihabitans fulvus]|uniref:Uncharacterized protein n=1 Tax=Solihabitans fulvus TaxID=1892852 RepID=A0A5B2XFU3_9PSEU|nr:hypothetical protein [Solihabitans fulvus]KAA2261761.1 hypothetical protein F0L68_15200 [Solihabitans fulvus]